MRQVPCMKHDAGILHLLFRPSCKVLDQKHPSPSPLGKNKEATSLLMADGFYVLECFLTCSTVSQHELKLHASLTFSFTISQSAKFTYGLVQERKKAKPSKSTFYDSLVFKSLLPSAHCDDFCRLVEECAGHLIHRLEVHEVVISVEL